MKRPINLSDFGVEASTDTSIESADNPTKVSASTPLPNQPYIPLNERKRVPNLPPKITNLPYRIGVVGEAPGRDEHERGEPFVGMSGKLLTQLLSKAAIVRDACFIGNVFQFRPADNDVSTYSPDGEEAKDGLARLEEDFQKFPPNVVLLLGKTALRAAKGVDNITDWRGSVFISNIPGPFYGRKCIASFHPAACLRQYQYTPLLMFDIMKAKKQAMSADYVTVERQLLSALSYHDLILELDEILEKKLEVSPDIEGWVHSVTCCSLATSPTKSILVPFTNMDGSNFWADEEEDYQVFSRFVRIMADPLIKKCWQNGLYDRFVLQYGLSIVVLGNLDDTMLKFWECYCELEKGLGSQCSLLTDEPYYKYEGKTKDRQTHFLYCCKDSANTFDINKKLDVILSESRYGQGSIDHYRQNHALLNPLLYMELQGIKYDEKEAKRRKEEVDEHIYRLQAELDKISGVGLNVDSISKEAISQTIADVLCHKRDPSNPKKGNEKAYHWCVKAIQKESSLSLAEIGRLNTLLDLSLNIKSKRYKTYLYDTLKLPRQYSGDPPHLSTDYLSLLKILKAIEKL